MAVEDAGGITVPEEELSILHQLKQLFEYVDKNALNIVKILRKIVCYGY